MRGARIVKTVCVLLLTGGLLAGCNTVAGFGEDITGAARSVQGGMTGGGYR